MISNKKKKVLLLATSLIMVAGGFFAIPSAQAAPSATCNLKSKPSNANCDVIVYGALHRVQSVDPLYPVGGYTESQMSYLVQGKLYRFDANGVPRRDLVASATISADKKTVTHVLRDAKYSDGTAVTAEDVVNAYQRWVDTKQSASYIDQV
ncbi:MAG: hypothetical protein EBW15_07405, partial [Actinobacteria bacterium]|nr:hypothetical protein [Actinomycetota bacterium]